MVVVLLLLLKKVFIYLYQINYHKLNINYILHAPIFLGTLIRLWNCHNGEPLRELRRGMDRAEIYRYQKNMRLSYNNLIIITQIYH